jgi:3-oxoacyl-[acyl-carrier protein] reductase
MDNTDAGSGRCLEGRVAFISGVAKTNSIGFATAEVFGEKGARLGIVDISEKVHECAALLRGRGVEVVSATADLTKAVQVRDAVNLIIQEYDRIDILVNNAGMAVYGIDEVFKEIADLTEEEWDFSIGINLKTQFNCIRLVLPTMIDKGYGRIVNISSVTGPIVANPGEGGYSAAKAGVVGLTRTLAIEVAKKGITVNAIAPGWVDTGSTTEEERVAGLNTAMGRPGTPREIAQLAAFLASDESSYITGQLIVIDGGNTIQEYKGPSDLYY